MGHSNIRLKVRRRKVAPLAARSKQFDVKNHMKKLAQSEDWKMVPFDTWLDKMPRFAEPHVAGKYYTVDKDGHIHWKDDNYKNERHKQPKSLMRYNKRKHTGEKWVTNSVGCPMRVYDTKRHKRNNFIKFFPNYPYNLPKMKKTEYWEALVQHKLAKWERKNPCPAEKDDLFKEDYVDPWVIKRNMAEERIRDFVVSVYDKLPIMGNRVDHKNHKMKAEKIAEIKDIEGKGHDVSYPNLSADDKLYKEASKKARNAMQMNAAILDADLVNHKRNQKRPLDAKRSKTVTLADKKLKKAA